MTARSLRWLRLALAVLCCLLVPRSALAMSCIDSAYERMELSLTAVFEGAHEVPTPRELGDLDELLNSGNEGRALLLWQARTMRFAKVYELAEPFVPAPAIAPWLVATSGRRLMTACGYAVAYSPILPGRYRFSQEHLDGAKEPVGIGDPELFVAPGRDRVELRFTLHGRRLRAEYAVLCASFEWDRGPKVCARAVPSDLPAWVEAPPEPAPAPPASAAGAGDPPPPVQPAAVARPVASVPRAPSQGGCAGCATVARRAEETPIAAIALGALGACAAARRSRRATSRRSGRDPLGVHERGCGAPRSVARGALDDPQQGRPQRVR